MLVARVWASCRIGGGDCPSWVEIKAGDLNESTLSSFAATADALKEARHTIAGLLLEHHCT